MKKIIYIAGLGHSGSTILDMALGCRPDIVGLGEIYAVLNKKNPDALFKNSTCSCGKKGVDCNFWKDLQSVAKSEKTTEEKYKKLIEIFESKYGNDTVLVDSSKNSYPYLQFLNKNFDLRVIYLTRDYRGWSFSRRKKVGKPLIFHGLRWYFENRKLLLVLKNYGLKIHYAGYEELALYPEITLRKICDFAGTDYSEKMLVPDNTNSHIINGNISRADTEKRKGFFYDFRWMTSAGVMALSGILSIFNKFNKKLVYSNISGTNKDDFHIFGNKNKHRLLKEHN